MKAETVNQDYLHVINIGNGRRYDNDSNLYRKKASKPYAAELAVKLI